jgi:extracellular factor (EF) 3-hydroxypalmitic acid methyl ester biosynthesis protein
MQTARNNSEMLSFEFHVTSDDGFHRVSSDEAITRAVIKFADPFVCRANKDILVQDSEPRYFYYVEKGGVEVSYTEQKTKIVVALIGAGSFFGEVGFFDNTSRVRDIRAIEDSIIRRFSAETLSRIEEESPSLYGRLLTLIIENVCAKFRRVLEDRTPLTAYGASLSDDQRSFGVPKPLPEEFFRSEEWRTVNQIVEEFKSQLYQLSYSLQQDPNPEPTETLLEQGYRVLGEFNDHLQGFQNIPRDAETEDLMWGYIFKEIFPFFMRSRFAERAYFKPLGYAGDYLMMEMIYRNIPAGDGKLGQLVDSWCLNTTAAKSVRGRRRLLSQELASLSRPFLARGQPVCIMNLACGSNRELFDFLEGCSRSELVEALCVDIDPEALKYTRNKIDPLNHSATIRLMNENIIKWAMGRSRHDFRSQDIIYSAGLTDYLEDRLLAAFIKVCYKQLKPGGVLVIGNFAPHNSERMFLDHLIHWRLIYRDKRAIRNAFVNSPFGEQIEIFAEEQGINLFVKAVKGK